MQKNKSITNLRDCAIVNLILKTGLRTVEVERANTDDIVEKGQYTYLYVQGKGRDDKDDPIKLPKSVLTLINEYLEKETLTISRFLLITEITSKEKESILKLYR